MNIKNKVAYKCKLPLKITISIMLINLNLVLNPKQLYKSRLATYITNPPLELKEILITYYKFQYYLKYSALSIHLLSQN